MMPFRPLSLMTQAQPRPFLGQMVDIKPTVNVTAPLKIELGGLPLSMGLFVGSGLSFLVRGALPKGWPQATALGAGLILGAAGVVNLIVPTRQAASSQSTPTLPPPPPSGVVESDERPQGYVPPSVPAFQEVQVELVSPKSGETISHTGTFLGIGSSKIPVQIRFFNPSDESVTLALSFEWDEAPALLGYTMSPEHGSKEYQVTLAPQEQRTDTFELPQVSPWSTLSVALAVSKKRKIGENSFLIVNTTFNVV